MEKPPTDTGARSFYTCEDWGPSHHSQYCYSSIQSSRVAFDISCLAWWG